MDIVKKEVGTDTANELGYRPIDASRIGNAKANSDNKFMHTADAFPSGDVIVVWQSDESKKKLWIGLRTEQIDVPISIPLDHLGWEQETNGVEIFEVYDEAKNQVILKKGLKMQKEKKEDRYVKFSN